jgi:iron(III) transport system permease protein
MSPRSFFRQVFLSLSAERVVYALVTGLFFFLVLCPSLGLIVDFVQACMAGSLDFISPLLLSSRQGGLLVSSIGLAAAVAGAGVLIGILIVSALWSISQKALMVILLTLLALAGIPSYIHALTWSAAITSIGGILPVISPTGWAISFWVELMALLPIAIFLSWVAFASVDTRLTDAGRVFKTDWEVFLTIQLPLAAPALGAALGFLFVICCSDYSVPSLFGADVYALEIFAQYSASNIASQALLYSLPLLIITLVVMVSCRSGIRTLAQTPNWLSARFGNPPRYPASFRVLQAIAVIIVITQIAVLFFGLISTSGSWDTFVSSVSRAGNELQFSLITALLVILISLPLALAAANELKKPGIRGTFAWILVLVPLAIPAPLVGIGLISFWNGPLLAVPYPGMLMPVLVAVSRFAPIAAIILFVQLRFIDPLLFDAAAVFSKSQLKTWTQIRLPLLSPGLLVTAGILFALTLAELGATLIVAPPGHATLTMRIYNYLHYGAAGEVAGLCLMITILTLVAGTGAILSLWWLYNRSGASQPVEEVRS